MDIKKFKIIVDRASNYYMLENYDLFEEQIELVEKLLLKIPKNNIPTYYISHYYYSYYLNGDFETYYNLILDGYNKIKIERKINRKQGITPIR